MSLQSIFPIPALGFRRNNIEKPLMISFSSAVFHIESIDNMAIHLRTHQNNLEMLICR